MQPKCKREGCNCSKHPQHDPYCCSLCKTVDCRFEYIRKRVSTQESKGADTAKLRTEWVAY